MTPSQRAVDEGRKLRTEAEDLFETQFKTRPARTTLDRAEGLLLAVPPTPSVIDELASINFLAGLIHLREQNRGLAISAFQLARTLDRDRGELDPASYKPDVVTAFREAGARARQKATATLAISATFDVPVYVDGKSAGDSPIEVKLTPGPHYVVAVAREYQAATIKIDVAAGESISEKLELHQISRDEQARNLRSDLIATVEPATRDQLAAAARHVAGLADADAAIVIWDGEDGSGRPVAAIYQSESDGLGFARPVDDDVDDMFGLLVPVPPPDLPNRDLFGNGPPPPTPWWQRPVGIVGLVSGGIAFTVLGVLALSLDDGPPSPRNSTLDGPVP